MAALSQKFRRMIMQEARALVEAAGGECWVEERHHGHHDKLVIRVRGIQRQTPLPGTPRAMIDDALRRKLCDVKRLLREMTR